MSFPSPNRGHAANERGIGYRLTTRDAQYDEYKRRTHWWSNPQSNSPFYFSSSASPQLTMKFTVATVLALPLLAVATPVALDARSDAGSCNTGPIQCCQQTISVSLCIYSYTSRRATNRCKFPRRAPPRRRTSSQACSGSSSAPLRLFLALAAPQSVSSASAVAALATLTPSAARTTLL